MTFQHVPVLLQETLSGLNIQPEGIYVDGTVGGAGHACEIAKQLHGAGRLIGLDRDPDAVAVATQRLAPYPATVIHANYDEMAQVLQRLEIPAVDGILLDLGVSSHQLDTEERGFSYHTDAPLDMRMSQSGMSAADVVNTWSQEELTRIICLWRRIVFSCDCPQYLSGKTRAADYNHFAAGGNCEKQCSTAGATGKKSLQTDVSGNSNRCK